MMFPDKKLVCASGCGETFHRFAPSPDAGPYWRCSECGEVTEPDEISEVDRLLAENTRLRKERNEAREVAEEGFRYMVEDQGEDPEEFCPPWMGLTQWLTLLGKLAEYDHDEMEAEVEAL